MSLNKSDISFHIHAVDKRKLTQAVGEIKKLISDLVGSEVCSKQCLKYLTNDEKIYLLSLGTSKVEVKFGR